MKVEDLLRRSFREDSNSLKELLDNKLHESGLSKTQFERLSRIGRKSLDPILNNSSKQTDIIKLLKIGEFLDLSVRELLILFLKDRPQEDITELQQSIELTFIHKHFDLKALNALGFISDTSDIESIKSRIKVFFGLENIFEYEKELKDVLYSRTKRSFSDKMKDFWIKSSYKYFELIDNPNDFNREQLVELIPKIKPYTANVEKGLLTVFQALFHIGVTVIFQPLLPKTQIRGATFIVNEKPCIVITDFNKNYATIWFALIHEPDLFLIQEDKANEFAREYLFSEDKLRNIEAFIHNPTIVTKKAKGYNVHPSIIYSMFQYWKNEQGENYWGAFKKEFPDIKKATAKLNYSNWTAESITETAEQIKSLLTV